MFHNPHYPTEIQTSAYYRADDLAFAVITLHSDEPSRTTVSILTVEQAEELMRKIQSVVNTLKAHPPPYRPNDC